MPSFSIIYLHVTKGSKYLLNVRILNWGLCILHKPEKCKWFGGIYSIFVEDISLLCWLLTLPQIDKKNKYGSKKYGCGSTSILSMANHTVRASRNFEFLDFVGLAVIVVSFFIVISTTNICKVRLTVVVVILCYKVNGKIKTFPSKEKLWNIWMHVHHLHMFQDTCTMSQHLYCPRLISKTFHFHFLNVRKKRLIVVLLVFKHSAKFYIIFSGVRKFIFSWAQLSVKLKF